MSCAVFVWSAIVLAAPAANNAPDKQQQQLLKTFRDEFVLLTPGRGKYPAEFVRGRVKGGGDNERPAAKVRFDYDFHVARYEVPQNLWEAVMGSNPSRWKGPRNSVEMLNYAEAVDFCRKATKLMRDAGLIKGDQEVRLPSEAEWEYFARAGTTTVYSFGDDASQLGRYGWYKGNAAGNDPPVGAKLPNAWGLYDIHGYLWEWCSDYGHESYQGAPNNGASWETGGDKNRRMARGGSWKDQAESLTSSFRQPMLAGTRDDAVGLRCVLTVARPAADDRQDRFEPKSQDKFVPAGAQVEMLWNAGQFTEGPALAPDGAILFTDIGNAIRRFDPATGEVTVFRQPSGKANGLMFDGRGQLVACEGAAGGNRRVSITRKSGQVESLAETWQGKRFNSPNDVAIHPNGDVYFTDPRYAGEEPRELPFEGVFCVREGKVALATQDVQRPNGIVISADGKTAYVADNNNRTGGNRHLLSFRVQPDGSLKDKRLLFDFGPGRRGIDGMTLDVDGNVYATAGRGDEAGVYVFGPNGENLAYVATPGDPTNCVFGGGEHARTLYITAQGPADATASSRSYALYQIRLKTGRAQLLSQ